MRRLVLASLLLLVLLPAPPAMAWSAFGHRLVALLAYDQLSPTARSQVDALLALEPGADIATIAPWPDEIRKNPGYEHTGPFHYVNFPAGSCQYAAARDCPGGACISAALPRYQAVLGDPGNPAQERLEALKFVVHLAGDVHQPMHAGNRDDRGGNQFQVRVGKEGTNLHAVWDYHLLKSSGLRLNQYRRELAARVAATEHGPLDAVAWAEASCKLLDSAAIYPRRPGTLPRGYLDQQRPLAEQQIVLAAARLAALLESSLGTVTN